MNIKIPRANSAKNIIPNAKLNINNKVVFSLNAPTQPQNPITKTNDPTTKNINAGSNRTPIDKLDRRVNVSFIARNEP